MLIIATFQGTRMPNDWCRDKYPQPGEYGRIKYANGLLVWHGCTPTGLFANLANHHVEEHEDGTISVVKGPWGSNSILVNGGRANAWHGCIVRGEWRQFKE